MIKKRNSLARSRFTSLYIPSRKGQVTVFIILGIILLLILVLLITFRKEILTFKPGELIPTEKGKIESLITACIEQKGEEALFQIGVQGGYIEVPYEIARDGSTHLRLSPFQVVPYWAYGEVASIPTLEQIQKRINMYLEENVPSCLFASEEFQSAYDLIEKSSLQAQTEIAASKVIFNVHWIVEVKNKAGETIIELPDHSGESQIKFKKVYDTSKAIVEKEMSELKLEDLTQDLLALEQKDVPLAGMEFSCSRKVWDVQKAKNTFQDMLRRNIKELKVSGTEFVEFPDGFDYYTNHYVWDYGEEFSPSDISIVFNYDNNYPFTFQVTPSEGGKLHSTMLGGTDLLSNLCLQNWKFTYDIVYPVLVRVKDETTGYIFQMAFTVHLIRNHPDRKSLVQAQAADTLDFVTDEEYCDQSKVPIDVFTWSKVENEVVSDSQPLNGVDVSFTCLKYRCEMGSSRYDVRLGDQASLRSNFPYCVGGIMRGTKAGYKEDFVRVVTGTDKEVNLNLAPLFSFPATHIKVVKHTFKGLQQPVSLAEPLAKDELALIRLTYFKNGEKVHQIEQVLGASIAEGTAGQKFDFLAQADFIYQVEVEVFNNEKVVGCYKANWTAPWSQLETAQEITFHTLGWETASDEDIFAYYQSLNQYSNYVALPEIK